jgi:hypothetical protein
MRDLSLLGLKPFSRREPAFRAPTDAEVAAFEAAFDARLPAEYVEFLRQFNGGRHPDVCAFTTKSGYTTAIDRFHYLLPEDPKRVDKKHHPCGWESGNLWAETRELRAAVRRNSKLEGLDDVRDQLTDRVVPFGIDNGGASLFVFDLRVSPPAVCLAVASRGFAPGSLSRFVCGLH